MSDSQTPAGTAPGTGTGTEKDSQAPAAGDATGNRKGPRLPLEFAVVVRYQAPNGEMVRSNCKTISVSVNGALLALNGTVEVGQSLQLTNVKTSQEVQCTVRSVRHNEKENINHVGIEFSVWTPEFWEITFPHQEGDPLPTPQPGKVHPVKPLFGRVGPMPSVPGEETQADADLEGPLKHLPMVGKLFDRIWHNKKAVIALAAVLAAVAVWAFLRPARQQQGTAAAVVPFVLPPRVAQVVPNSAGFRLAMASDFAPEATELLTQLGQSVSGEIAGAFAGSGQSRAYLMVKNDKSWRVGIVVDGQLRCDARYQSVAIAARIPQEVVRRMSWSAPPQAQPDGDGLLIVRSVRQRGSAVVLFLHGNEVISGTPADYGQIPALQTP